MPRSYEEAAEVAIHRQLHGICINRQRVIDRQFASLRHELPMVHGTRSERYRRYMETALDAAEESMRLFRHFAEGYFEVSAGYFEEMEGK